MVELFDDDRSWLERQPQMDPWDRGRRELLSLLRQWAVDYAAECRIDGDTTSLTQKLVMRLWNCWSYHWRSAAEANHTGCIDGRMVAEKIMRGQSCNRDGGRLGGNPLRDVVLAEAVVRRFRGSIVLFDDEFKDVSLRLACARFQYSYDDVGWWDDLTRSLIGDDAKPGKLTKFAGHCGLKNWLGTVVRRHLASLPPRPVSADDAITATKVAADGHVVDDLISRECLGLVARHVGQAVDRLSPEYVVILSQSLVEGLSGIQIAAILGKAPGTVSRLRERALNKFQSELGGELTASTRTTQSFRDCLAHVLQGDVRRTFADFLTTALRTASRPKVLS